MALFPFTINDHTYNLADFAGLNYVTAIPDSMVQIISQVSRRKFNGLSTNTQLVGIGAKSFTGTALIGLNWKVGDYLVAFSGSSWMSGTITAYNSITGATSVTMDQTGGSAITAAMNLVKSGEHATPNIQGPLEPLQGGTGAGGAYSGAKVNLPCNQFGSSIAGIGAGLSEAMVEIYDDFASFQEPTSMRSASDPSSKWLASPYYSNNVSFNYASDAANTGSLASFGNAFGGEVKLKVLNRSISSATFSYGQNGFILAGSGRLIFEFLVSCSDDDINIPATNPVASNFRFGLRGQGSGSAANIFSFSGIGFERLGLAGYNGKLSAFVGNSGVIFRQILPVTMVKATVYKLGIECSADANMVRFFVNGNMVLEKKILLPSAKLENLMHPCFEIQLRGGNAIPRMMVDSIWLRKNLQR